MSDINTQHETLGIEAGNRKEALHQAEQSAGMWLYRGNRAREKGKLDLAERHYTRAQKYHDEMNRLLGNAS